MAPFPLVDQGEEEESQEAPPCEPVGTTVAIAPEVPEASLREEEDSKLPEEPDRNQVEKGPQRPVMLHLLALLERELGISHPRRKEPWPTLEADFDQRYSGKEQDEFLAILDRAFTHSPHFRTIFADPKKKDLIRLFINRANDMRKDFEAHRAKAMVSQSILLANQTEGANSEVVETIPPVVVESPPVENIEPTLPLGKLFLQCLQDKGLMYHDTSTWDAIEKALPGKYSAALLLEAPNAIRLVLAGEDLYWYPILFDGKKENQFKFFMNNLTKIVQSLQASKARGQLTTKTKESHGLKKPNKYSGMVDN
jgi:hypothetical protein